MMMTLWLDAQLSPRLAYWLGDTFQVVARAVRDVGLRDADDDTIYQEAAKAGAVVITKDRDFIDLQLRLGPPPPIIWLTCGNTSEDRLRQIFTKHFAVTRRLLEAGDPLVEITGE
jgi:predicted nuclease of predicted toxin-antitoxin system